MPLFTYTNQAQIDYMVREYPNSTNRRRWAIGFQIAYSDFLINALSRLGPPAPKQRKPIEKWWTVDEAPLP